MYCKFCLFYSILLFFQWRKFRVHYLFRHYFVHVWKLIPYLVMAVSQLLHSSWAWINVKNMNNKTKQKYEYEYKFFIFCVSKNTTLSTYSYLIENWFCTQLCFLYNRFIQYVINALFFITKVQCVWDSYSILISYTEIYI